MQLACMHAHTHYTVGAWLVLGWVTAPLIIWLRKKHDTFATCIVFRSFHVKTQADAFSKVKVKHECNYHAQLQFAEVGIL